MKKNYLEALAEASSFGCVFDDCYLDSIGSLALVVYFPAGDAVAIPYEE